MANAAAPTVPALKQSFLSIQTTLLAQPLAPSRAWQAANDASDSPLPARAVDDALFALNHSIQRHCRRVYAPQATRHIAEQVNDVYMQDAQRRVARAFDGAGEGVLRREMDLTRRDTIEALPETWISDQDAENYPMEAKRYADAVRRLAELNEQRNELRAQVDRLSRLQAVIQPLRTGDGGAGIQENLLTRDGPVEKELERMRFLLARVGGRVNALPDGGASDTPPTVPVTSSESLGLARKRRIDQFLADDKVFPA
ncbi:kinetochore complex Fta4 of Sim4 subunit, or CENP-50-domain-containing protein [Dactylonectria macrodidyma]|uniref:Kinetochore complex Fta4 of Sim4 subunit, or CENP-50-domain-containing protein n=1 Tax=Dactylonectria macrodidyma TaxID=307937 RepID=A0A9P9DM03_9HYPO|nr:kinetochore complex Fta4 of Sim4 subunit, or CENP-50-domain-containing protein [Dactylonectria macrodidyma]